MKAGIITHYNVHNHGAVLQMYALTKQLGSLGYDAKALQFQKNYDFMGREKAANKYAVSLRSVPYYINYLLKQPGNDDVIHTQYYNCNNGNR